MESALNRLVKVDIGSVVKRWQAWYVESAGNVRTGEAAAAATNDPRHPDCVARKRSTYNVYFKKQDMGTWWHLPRYLSAGTKLGKEAVRGMVRFRTSSHSLGIETGRWNGRFKIPFQQRICKRCVEQGRGEHVDDEVHLAFECMTCEDLRTNRFADLFGGVNEGDLRHLMAGRKQLKLARFIQLGVDRVDAWLAAERMGNLQQQQG